MAKRRNEESVARFTTKKDPDERPEQNLTLLALLRDGEKIKASDPHGILLDRLGHVFEEFIADQHEIACTTGAAAKGSITLSFAFEIGADGTMEWVCQDKVKLSRMPARRSRFSCSFAMAQSRSARRSESPDRIEDAL